MGTLLNDQGIPSRVPSIPEEEVESSPRSPQEAEAPDRGEQELDAEAPEARVEQFAENPDAGEGRMSVLEGEFTHGRSQS
jgi:hypothetical protein